MGSLAVMLIALFAPLPELSHPGKSAKSNDASCPLVRLGSHPELPMPQHIVFQLDASSHWSNS